jgi:hypothetical protein
MNVFKLKVKNKYIESYGTCFAISENKVLTANHILLKNSKVLALINNIWYSCKILKQDVRLDLAILQVNMSIILPYCKFDMIVSAENIYSFYYVNKSEKCERLEGNIVNINQVSDFCIDSTIVNYIIEPGASGCPIFKKNNNNVIGIISWSNKEYSGGCVLRLIIQFISMSIINKYSIDCLLHYENDHAVVLKTNIDQLKSETKIYSLNGVNVGKKFISVESILYFNSLNTCHVVQNENDIVVEIELKKHSECEFVAEKPWANINYLEECFLRCYSKSIA